ncbi:MAG TPA: Wzz/FepE/Etk N-terminal domain-containing protein [Bryobacteraceae bacterium]|nr:Wzz/FepE/Etk N-terminal domain-containing protein [Bryobacteraceae bacterium]
MQPNDPITVPRRALDIEDYIDILRRHKSWILGPAFLGLVVGVVVAFLWPDTYVSVASIRVVPPQVPASLVQTNLNEDLTSRVMAMAQQIMSRTKLTTMILTLNLYPKERARMPLEDVLEQMQKKDVSIGAVQNTDSSNGRGQVTAFQISFKYYDKHMATKVVEDLTSEFLTESEKELVERSRNTTDFLNDQYVAAKKKLDDAEGRLAAFRMKNMGRLPDEVQNNIQQLNALNVQMSNVDAAMSRINQEKLLLENQLRIAREQLSSLKEINPEQQLAQIQKDQAVAEKQKEVSDYESALATLRQRYKDTHPDVQRVMGLLAAAKAQRDALIKQQTVQKVDPSAKPASAPLSHDARALEIQIQQLQAQIAAKDLDMRDRQKEITNLNEAMRQYQARIEGVPVGEKEYGELMAEARTAREEAESLQKRLNISREATDLQNRSQGERLELLDPASVPTSPTEPKRSAYVGAGLAIGLVLGLVLAGVREMKDTSLKNLKDVRAYTKLPVLGSIPLLENDLVVRRRRRIAWLAWSTACLVGVAIICSSIVYYYATRA